MNEITQNNSTSLDLSRTDVLAKEINIIKNQTKRIMLYNSIEIGRRLVEAKQLIAHGEWGKWLEQSVDYSQRTAQNLIRIFEEYGADQLTLLEDNAKSQAIANLSYTQAVALLIVPEEEREKFIEDNDIENMSTRELQQAIKDRDKALKEKEELEEKLKNTEERAKEAEETNKKLDEIIDKHYKKSKELTEELDEVKKQLQNAQKENDIEEMDRLQTILNEKEDELNSSQKKISELEQQLKERPVEVKEVTVEKVPENLEKELQELRELREKTSEDKSAVKFQVIFDGLVKNFNELLIALKEIKDIETCEKYKKAVSTLINMMGRRL